MHHLLLLLISSLGKKPEWNYGWIFLVCSRLILLSMVSCFPGCCTTITWSLVASGHKVYQRQCYRQSTFFFVHTGLLSLGLQHFQWRVYILIKSSLCDIKLSCFLFWVLTRVWLYCVPLTFCPHKYTRDPMWEYPSSLAYILSLSEHICLLHVDKLSTKGWCINCKLIFLIKPLDMVSAHMYQEDISQSVRYLTSWMISIHKHYNRFSLTHASASDSNFTFDLLLTTEAWVTVSCTVLRSLIILISFVTLG